MLVHNTDVAMRNLTKYKMQTGISLLSMAIGIVVLATVHSILQLHLRPRIITTTPHFERACRLELDSIERLQPVPEHKRRTVWVGNEVLRAIAAGGELFCAETGVTYPNGMMDGGDVRITLGDTLERRTRLHLAMIEPKYPNFAGYVSAISGKPVAVLREGQALISAGQARRLLGKVNPIGARIEAGYAGMEVDVTIADVYRDLGQMDGPTDPTAILYTQDNEATMASRYYSTYSTPYLNVILKEGCTPEQMEQEVNPRLEPLGVKVKAVLEKDKLAEELKWVFRARTLIYFLGSLILVAACIGYLRMQLQLFWMRKREMALRMVNGAKRRDLFVLLMTEVGIMLAATVGVALILGYCLEVFVNFIFLQIQNIEKLHVALDNLVPYSLVIGAVLLVLCALLVWIALNRICNNALGLAGGMRPARNHTFRNTMLGLQVTIGMFFVSAALVCGALCERVAAEQILPEDESRYRESILLNAGFGPVQDFPRICERIREVPDLAQMIPYSGTYCQYAEILEKATTGLEQSTWYCRYTVKDTALLDFLDVETTWLKPELKGQDCILIHEDLYARLESEGALANGILTVKYPNGLGPARPVAGTFKDILFDEREGYEHTSFIEFDKFRTQWWEYILRPREGRYETLMGEVQTIITRLEPALAYPIAKNYFEAQAPQVILPENVRKAGWTLGAVALLVCVMGIYSTIALDTRARRKEVAIRKINGAKTGDIASLFSRMYVVLVTIALLIVMPIAGIIQYFFATESDKGIFTTLPVAPLALAGCAIVVLSIVLIVGWHVHRVMRVNPADMIAKE